MSPSIAIALILCLPIWGLVDGIRPLVNGRSWHPIAVRVAPFLFGVALCSVPGLIDLVAFDWLGYEPPLRYLSPFACGVTAGGFATVAHALGLREGLTRMAGDRIRGILGVGPKT